MLRGVRRQLNLAVEYSAAFSERLSAVQLSPRVLTVTVKPIKTFCWESIRCFSVLRVPSSAHEKDVKSEAIMIE